MREPTDKPGVKAGAVGSSTEGVQEVPYDEKTFFDSFYSASVRGDPEDWMTIGAITDVEARFHYNATENAILRAFSRLHPPARGGMIAAARMLGRRRGARLLDVGSGTGHWIDFFREVLYASEVHGVEIAERMAGYLREKYAADDGVHISQHNIAEEFGPEQIGGDVDWISAIGVMFHIVDDARWRAAMRNLAACLRPGGLLFVGGDFGAESRNVQFHRSDEFRSWREFERAEAEADTRRVNKRVRSLAAWTALAGRLELELVDLVRTDSEPLFLTPENDILLLRRPDPER